MLGFNYVGNLFRNKVKCGLSIKVQGEDSCVLMRLSSGSQAGHRRVESLGQCCLQKPPTPQVQILRLGAHTVPSLLSIHPGGRGKSGVES